jgi:hypothetical protein
VFVLCPASPKVQIKNRFHGISIPSHYGSSGKRRCRGEAALHDERLKLGFMYFFGSDPRRLRLDDAGESWRKLIAGADPSRAHIKRWRLYLRHK